jgi:hypothetical protein
MLCGTEPENLPHRGLSIDVAKALGDRRDRELVRVLERMLEPDPDRRLSELHDLKRLVSGPGAGAARPRERHPRRERRERKAAAREERRQRRRARSRGPLMPGLFVFALLGLGIASVVVSAVLLVAVPLVLMILSVFFGPKLRNAAAAVRAAGHRSNRSLAYARDRVMARGVDDESHSEPGQRDAEAERHRTRVRVEEERQTSYEEAEEAEEDDAASEPSRQARRKAR